MSTIGQNIKLCRERQNITQQELARKIRVGLQTVEKFESGERRPDTQTILNISTVLDIPASELLEKEFQLSPSGIDHETEQLVREIGTKKAKLVLRKIKELDEEDYLRVMQMMSEIKNKNQH
ncbi:helix-turn-helix domain-containing protein [Bacillus sp. 1NLA3E]|uniref:helix-turn-helix domain-containing protein n=1 Tax=Bacillus sp. 1NLA3E TaxID=666686 RepID=UPI000247F3A7|nr:helix-turn-helix transcriptional regulator [Bacillus sp. 1NLA3E]